VQEQVQLLVQAQRQSPVQVQALVQEQVQLLVQAQRQSPVQVQVQALVQALVQEQVQVQVQGQGQLLPLLVLPAASALARALVPPSVQVA